MKSLNQVEPRTPIGTLPFTITEPGSYYFTKNLEFTAATGHAITVNASNVTIDLMGFTLSSTAPVTGSGIVLGSLSKGVTITNGSITGATIVNSSTWAVTSGGFGLAIAGGYEVCHYSRLAISGCRSLGLHAANVSIVEDVTVTQCGNGGIEANNSTVRNCTAHINASSVNAGISGGTINNCVAQLNQRDGLNGFVVSQCKADGNGWCGIRADMASQCVSRDNQQGGFKPFVTPAAVIVNCNATGNSGDAGISNPNGVVSFSVSNNNTAGDISAAGATRTGNNPAP